MNENNEPQAWEEELRNIYSLCIEAPGKRLMFENYLLPFIRTLRQKDKERLMVGIDKLIGFTGSRTEPAVLREDVKKLLTENYE